MDMDIWQWVLTLVGAVALAWIGSYLGRRTEHAKWLREHRFNAYREYIVATDRHSVVQLPNSLPAGPDRDKLVVEANAYLFTLRESATMISFLGPEEMRHHAHDLRTRIRKALETTPVAPLIYKDPDEEMVASRERFIEEGRKVLAVSQPKRSSFRMTAIW